jgi:7-cyano-7-deazaguanine synthase
VAFSGLAAGVTEPKPKAVVLLSGGLDSATVAAVAQAQGFEVWALSFDYGQRHRFELTAAQKVAEALGVRDHRQLSLDLRAIGGSALTSASIDVPHRDDGSLPDPSHAIPVTYVPARNTIFLSVALGWAEVIGAFDIFFGANAVDYSGYPDCRPAFVEAFEALANVATREAVSGRGRFRVHAPLIHLTKAEIILLGQNWGVDYGLTHSCYDPSPSCRPCGSCDACLLRARGFAEAGTQDPAAALAGK